MKFTLRSTSSSHPSFYSTPSYRTPSSIMPRCSDCDRSDCGDAHFDTDLAVERLRFARMTTDAVRVEKRFDAAMYRNPSPPRAAPPRRVTAPTARPARDIPKPAAPAPLEDRPIRTVLARRIPRQPPATVEHQVPAAYVRRVTEPRAEKRSTPPRSTHTYGDELRRRLPDTHRIKRTEPRSVSGQFEDYDLDAEKRRFERTTRPSEPRAVIKDSTPPVRRFSRACGVCLTQEPRRRAVLSECGHTLCRQCADRMQADASRVSLVRCPFCRTKSKVVTLHEERVEAERENARIRHPNRTNAY